MSDVDEYQEEIRSLRKQLTELRTGMAEAAGAAKVKPVTMSETLRAMLAALPRAGTEHSTVALKNNAKGDTQIEVSIRTDDHGDIRTVEDAAAKAREIYDSLRMLYPMGGPQA